MIKIKLSIKSLLMGESSWKNNRLRDLMIFSAERPNWKYKWEAQYVDGHLIINLPNRCLIVFMLSQNRTYDTPIHHSSTLFFVRYDGFGNSSPNKSERN